MTMVTLDVIKSMYLQEKLETVREMLHAYDSSWRQMNMPEDIKGLNKSIKAVEALRLKVQGIELSLDIKDIERLITAEYDKEKSKYQKKEQKINEVYEGMVNDKVRDFEEEAKFYNLQLSEQWKKDNSIYVRAEEKRKMLEKYSDDIIDVCDAYGIMLSDISVNNESFSIDELEGVYDGYLSYMKNRHARKNPIRWLRSKVKNEYMQVGVIAVMFTLILTPVWDFVAVMFFVYVIYLQTKVKEQISTYTLLYGLVYNVQPLNMGYRAHVDPEMLKSENVSEDDERLAAITAEWAQKLDELEQSDPEDSYQKLNLEYASHYSEMCNEFDVERRGVLQEKEKILRDLDMLLEHMQDSREELKGRIKLLGERYSMGYVMDMKFALGIGPDMEEEFYDFGQHNIIIRSCRDEALMQRFMLVMLANALLNVRANSVDIHVIDPNSKCRGIMSLYDSNQADILHMNDDASVVLKDASDFLDKNMKQMAGLDIGSFNHKCEEDNSTPRDYMLVVVLSQGDNIFKSEEWQNILKMSAEYGLVFWVVADELEVPDTVLLNKPFEGINSPYNIDVRNFSEKVKKTFGVARENAKLSPLTFDSFMANTTRMESYWWNGKKFSNDYIEIRPGYYEGDPHEYKGFSFGHSGNIHMLAVGGTGAGKSVFLNFMTLDLCSRYSPPELELWMIDFKGAEFIKYMATESNGYKALPHVKVCLCTSDGDYAGSVYTAFRREAERRYQMLKDMGLSSLKEYNKRMIQQGTPDKCLPRMLMVNDEFQVIFEKAESKIIDQINKDIVYVSKVGRAAGVHLMFTSQSMSGTMKGDTLTQFSLRFVLRCDVSVSNDILGTKHAGLIREANGFLYVRSEGIDNSNPPRYRTPFIDDSRPKDEFGRETGELSEVEKAICRIYDEAEKVKFRQSRVITYDENKKHSIKEIDLFYEKNRDRIASTGRLELENLMILGERMTYAESAAPEHVILGNQNNTHIFAVFNNYVDFINFYKTIIRNIQLAVSACDFVVNCQVADLSYLCELDKDIPGELLQLSSEKIPVAEFINFVQQIYDKRKVSGFKETPLYVLLLGWDKALGFGIDKDSRVVQQTQILMQQCAEYHIHFIFICGQVGGIATGVRSACRFKICGKGEEDDSMGTIETKQAYKAEMKDGFFYMLNKGNVTRAKLYQYNQTRVVAGEQLSF